MIIRHEVDDIVYVTWCYTTYVNKNFIAIKKTINAQTEDYRSTSEYEIPYQSSTITISSVTKSY